MNISLRLYLNALVVVLVSTTVYADITTSITPDSTMNGFSTTVTPAGNLYTVTGGKTTGNNLFHSFSSFNINSADTATFTAPGITNIISRVTGAGSSSVFGTLNASSNFFLVNPNGVIIGNTASINVTGAFYVSTADYLKLTDGVEFSASNPGDGSSLTTAPPSAFGFTTSLPASIEINGAQIYNTNMTAISLVGGDVTIVDGIIHASDGKVSIASVASGGEVPIDIKSMNVSDFTSLGTIDISNPSGSFPIINFRRIGSVDASGDTGGEIVIRGGNFYLHDGIVKSEVFDGSNLTKGKELDIIVSGEAKLTGIAKLSTITHSAGNAGDISLSADSIIIEDETFISSDTNDDGSGGVISLKSNLFSMSGSPSISANTLRDGSGGSVMITTDDMQMSGVSTIRTLTAFPCSIVGCSKDAGNITINASTIAMYGDATVDSGSFVSSDGKAGKISVNADVLQMNDDSWFISNTLTSEDAGQIELNINHITMRDRSVISTTTLAAGNGGTITLNGQTLSMSESAVITSGTEGSGSAGSVVINMNQINNTGTTVISSETEGNNFFVRNTADLTNATGGGDGGQVNISTASMILDGRAQIISGTGGSGVGGDVNIVVNEMTLLSDSEVSATSAGTGNAGSIKVTATDSVTLNGGAITTETINADGGNITVNAQELVYLQNGTISTSVNGGAGNGGNISIDPVYVVLNNSQIIANANAGNGGNITIVAENFIQDQVSIVEASSNLGIDGTVSIESPNQDVGNNIVELPDSFLSVLGLASQECALKTRSDISSLVISGRDGLPSSPGDLLPAHLNIDDAHVGPGNPTFVMHELVDADNPDLIRKLIVQCNS